MQKITYNADDLAQILGISKSAAYELFHREDFPTLRIGSRLLVVIAKFDEWRAAQSQSAAS